MGSRQSIRLFALASLGFAALTAEARDPFNADSLARGLVVEKTRGASPEVGEEAEAVQGSAVYVELEQAYNPAARLVDPVWRKGKYLFRTGKVLRKYELPDGESYCGGDSRSRFICLFGRRGDAGNLYYMHDQYGTARDLKEPVSYAVHNVELDAGDLSRVGATKVRAEILYQGAAGGVLRLLYREYSNDMARPAFSQELTYDLGELPMVVAVKGARIEVLEAGNAGIRYRILSGFDAQ